MSGIAVYDYVAQAARLRARAFLASFDLAKLTPLQVAALLDQALPGLINEATAVGTQAGDEYYQAARLRGMAGEEWTPPGVGKLRPGVVDAGLLEEVAAGRLVGQLLRDAIVSYTVQAATGAARSRVRRLIRSDPSPRVRWARVPTGAVTCAWCKMLASRGFAYTSADAAGLAGQFHRHCDCRVVPAFGDRLPEVPGYDPAVLKQEYDAVRRAVEAEPYREVLVNGRMRRQWIRVDDYAIAAKWRQMFPDRVSDGKHTRLMRKTRSDSAKPARVTPDGSYVVDKHTDLVRLARDKLAQVPSELRFGKHMPPEMPQLPPEWWPSQEGMPLLRAKEWNHILYGDHRGEGGHLFGHSWRHKPRVDGGPITEFPVSWTADTVAKALAHVCKTGVPWEQNGLRGTFQGVSLVVRIGTRKTGVTRVITCYPLYE